MNNPIYISYCTEYEFGQRPDGFMIGKTVEGMKEPIEKSSGGSSECYWRYDTPKLVFCDDETYSRIINDMGEKEFVNYPNSVKKELNLFEKL